MFNRSYESLPVTGLTAHINVIRFPCYYDIFLIIHSPSFRIIYLTPLTGSGFGIGAAIGAAGQTGLVTFSSVMKTVVLTRASRAGDVPG
jgi:hypothetical protein